MDDQEIARDLQALADIGLLDVDTTNSLWESWQDDPNQPFLEALARENAAGPGITVSPLPTILLDESLQPDAVSSTTVPEAAEPNDVPPQLGTLLATTIVLEPPVMPVLHCLQGNFITNSLVSSVRAAGGPRVPELDAEAFDRWPFNEVDSNRQEMSTTTAGSEEAGS
jgi:hypothetical protein